ncbi:uncharacterized protein TRAVEDRAFT_21030 [Trametes versicolor FP-101664 SS1]|uniref:uncharacterized protein n=1 Tax=Trametes versicolor (strain FP-101664) TaxID=717944 RepID=UPI0004624327|nr:uncharacterized protein TRAVEDRAFT_21030 [Trametes versicolor FP-101664 SS1]EIW57411.1 hypothetical protein TRAVEDRAFT_21030 [Trametes versicolor FP-101664 SS1]
MLIDFDCGEVHECTFIENSIKFHAPMPEAGDIGCYEIWQAAQEADVWPSCLANEGRIPVGDILLGRQHIIAFQLDRGVGVEHVEENADRVLSHLQRRRTACCVLRRIPELAHVFVKLASAHEPNRVSAVNAEYTPGSPILELPSVILQRCVAIPGNDDLDIAVSEEVSPLDVNFQQLSLKTPGLTRLPCCVAGSKASTAKYTIANFTQWYQNETTTSVFLAELEASLVDGGTGRTTREVVCKVVGAVPVNLKALRLEASLYRDKLEKLQGIHVAEFLGLFEGSAAGDKPYAILVTVFEGDTLNRELVEYDVDFRSVMRPRTPLENALT